MRGIRQPSNRQRKTAGLQLPPFESADTTISQETARNCLFDAIARVAPEVLRELAQNPWTQYQRIAQPLPPAHDLLSHIREGGSGPLVWPPVQWNLTSEFDDALDTWQQAHRLPEPWCRERALWTLARWQLEPQMRGEAWAYAEQKPAVRIVPGVAFSVRHFSISLLGWDPREETFEAFIAREDIEGKLWEYRQQVEEAIGIAKLVRTPDKREVQHFEWLALYQVRGWSYAQIRDKYGQSWRTTVADAVKTTAVLVGLTLRIPKPGRPVGVKEFMSRHRAHK